MKYLVSILVALAALAGGVAYTSASSSATVTPITHVVLVAEENHSQATVTGTSMPYLTSLGRKYARTKNYLNIAHPSLPNYLALTEGNTGDPTSFNHVSDCGTSTANCLQVDDNIYHQADVAGLGWNQWSESMKTNCQSSNASPYVVHHAPAPFFTDLVNSDCRTQDVPFSKLAPRTISAGFTFVTPNLNDDAHNGSLGVADNWLKTVLTKLMTQPNYTNGSTLIEVTFDETGASTTDKTHIYTAFINSRLAGKTLLGTYNHYSLLRLNEELLGLPLLGQAASATDMRSELGL